MTHEDQQAWLDHRNSLDRASRLRRLEIDPVKVRQKEAEKQRLLYQKSPHKGKKKSQLFRKKRKDLWNAQVKRRYLRNPAIIKWSNSAIAYRLGMNVKSCPDSLIEAKREVLMAKQFLKQLKRNENAQESH